MIIYLNLIIIINYSQLAINNEFQGTEEKFRYIEFINIGIRFIKNINQNIRFKDI